MLYYIDSMAINTDTNIQAETYAPTTAAVMEQLDATLASGDIVSYEAHLLSLSEQAEAGALEPDVERFVGLLEPALSTLREANLESGDELSAKIAHANHQLWALVQAAPTDVEPAELLARVLEPQQPKVKPDAAYKYDRLENVIVELGKQPGAARANQLATELMDLATPTIRSVLAKMGIFGDDADDIHSQVIMRIWQKADRFSPDKTTGWIARITRNAAIDSLRKKDRQHEDLAVNGLVDQPPDSSSFERHSSTELEELIGQLRGIVASEFLQPFLLRWMLDYSNEQIGEMLGLPAGTVKSRVSRGREKIARAIESGLIQL